MPAWHASRERRSDRDGPQKAQARGETGGITEISILSPEVPDGLAGCFETDPGTSINYTTPAPFVASAYFWSHTYGIKSLKEMLELVDKRDTDKKADKTIMMMDPRYRIDLAQPPAPQP
jgi:hypothetical protein